MFRYQNNFVTNEKGKVIAVSGGLDNENRNIVMEQKNGKVHQRWRIIYVDEYKGEPTKGQFNDKFGLYVERDFYVVSSLPDNRYLDLINNRNMVIKTKNGRRTQVWYFHQQSLTIRTRYNNQSWDIKSAGRTNDMQIWSTNSGWFQVFKYQGNQFINWSNSKVLEVQNQNLNTDAENRNIMVGNRGKDIRQQWEVIYVDEYSEPKKGELNSDFGLYVERDFYVVNQMASHKYLDLINNRNMVIKTQNGRRTQVWYFHQQSKTIRTRYNNQSWDIKSAGRTNNMQIWSTNSGWF